MKNIHLLHSWRIRFVEMYLLNMFCGIHKKNKPPHGVREKVVAYRHYMYDSILSPYIGLGLIINKVWLY